MPIKHDVKTQPLGRHSAELIKKAQDVLPDITLTFFPETYAYSSKTFAIKLRSICFNTESVTLFKKQIMSGIQYPAYFTNK